MNVWTVRTLGGPGVIPWEISITNQFAGEPNTFGNCGPNKTLLAHSVGAGAVAISEPIWNGLIDTAHASCALRLTTAVRCPVDLITPESTLPADKLSHIHAFLAHVVMDDTESRTKACCGLVLVMLEFMQLSYRDARVQAFALYDTLRLSVRHDASGIRLDFSTYTVAGDSGFKLKACDGFGVGTTFKISTFPADNASVGGDGVDPSEFARLLYTAVKPIIEP